MSSVAHRGRIALLMLLLAALVVYWHLTDEPVLARRAATTAASAPLSPVGDAIVATGTLEGAAYRIDVPRAWNHNLVVFFHGYAPAAMVPEAAEPLMPWLREFVKRGYAVIQSGYSAGGWAIEEGSVDSERLRRLFEIGRASCRERV